MKITIISDKGTKEYFSDRSVRLSDVIKELGVEISMPCAGMGLCGKCIVSVSGKVSSPSENEIRILGDRIKSGERLACQTFVQGDSIVLISEVKELKGEYLTSEIKPVNPLTGKRKCISSIIDIGTTTVAAQSFEMPSGKLRKSLFQLNAQTIYGSDVVSRIDSEINNHNGKLGKIIQNQISDILNRLDNDGDVIITGNTTMLYLLSNTDVSCLASFPFEIKETFGKNVKLPGLSENIYLPKTISAFIGSDIMCGIISSGMMRDENSVLIDLGTNSEIVYKHGDKFICASASAGPVFEGASIECGSYSVPGAINSVYNIGNRIEFTSVPGGKVKSICGSGVIDAVAVMLSLGYIENDGYLEDKVFIGQSDVYISPSDVRKIQLAKSAIFSALTIVCDDFSKVDKFYISGGFGSSININNAVRIGLFPKEILGKVVFCGNTSLSGAKMILFDASTKELTENIYKNCKTEVLSQKEEFNKLFVENMNFG